MLTHSRVSEEMRTVLSFCIERKIIKKITRKMGNSAEGGWAPSVPRTEFQHFVVHPS